MATLHDAGGEPQRVVYVKGAVERLLERCADALDGTGAAVPLDAAARPRAAWTTLAADGLRVLAFARGAPARRTRPTRPRRRRPAASPSSACRG